MLLVQAGLFVEFFQLALNDFLDDLVWLAGGPGLLAVDLPLLGQDLRGDFVALHEPGLGGGDVHGQVVGQLLELIGAGHEVGLAVDLHQHPDLAPGVDVAGDGAFVGGAPGLALRGGHPFLPQPGHGLPHVAAALGQRLLAVHPTGSRLLAQLLHLLGVDDGFRALGGIVHLAHLGNQEVSSVSHKKTGRLPPGAIGLRWVFPVRS